MVRVYQPLDHDDKSPPHNAPHDQSTTAACAGMARDNQQCTTTYLSTDHDDISPCHNASQFITPTTGFHDVHYDAMCVSGFGARTEPSLVGSCLKLPLGCNVYEWSTCIDESGTAWKFVSTKLYPFKGWIRSCYVRRHPHAYSEVCGSKSWCR